MQDWLGMMKGLWNLKRYNRYGVYIERMRKRGLFYEKMVSTDLVHRAYVFLVVFLDSFSHRNRTFIYAT